MLPKTALVSKNNCLFEVIFQKKCSFYASLPKIMPKNGHKKTPLPSMKVKVCKGVLVMV